MIVLDTNVISEIINPSPNQRVLDWFGRQERTALFTTVITQIEMASGVARLPTGKRRELLKSKIDEIFAIDFADRVLPLTSESVLSFVAIASQLRETGRPIGMNDLYIAAIAQAHEAKIATRNVKDFVNTGVPLIDPFT